MIVYILRIVKLQRIKSVQATSTNTTASEPLSPFIRPKFYKHYNVYQGFVYINCYTLWVQKDGNVCQNAYIICNPFGINDFTVLSSYFDLLGCIQEKSLKSWLEKNNFLVKTRCRLKWQPHLRFRRKIWPLKRT